MRGDGHSGVACSSGVVTGTGTCLFLGPSLTSQSRGLQCFCLSSLPLVKKPNALARWSLPEPWGSLWSQYCQALGHWQTKERRGAQAGLPHALILGTSQRKAHNLMAKASQRASHPPFLLTVVSRSLLFSVVTSTESLREEMEFRAEKMKIIEASGFLQGEGSWTGE